MNEITTRWVERDADAQKVADLQSQFDLPNAIARVMVARGINAELGAKFLTPKLEHLPDPKDFSDMAPAVERIAAAIQKREIIGIFGDYDVDGVTSTALMCDFLEQLGAAFVPMIPDRLKDGYGLSLSGVESLQRQGAKLIITVDCGVTAHQEVEDATRRGLDVIVIDHHTVPVELPKAVAVINPHRPDCVRKAYHLCAVGVVFNLCIALRRYLREHGFFRNKPEPSLHGLLDLVALGTVADVVPLIEENRIFVTQGLALIGRSTRPGLRAILDVAGIEPKKVTSGTLGFHIGPRINAAGRLEDAGKAVELLRAKEYWQALSIAKELDAQNQSRRDLEKKILEEAVAEVSSSSEHQQSFVTVIGREEWHPGVVGIVASRLVERFAKPAVVIGAGGKGSGRSIAAFHLHEALTAVRHRLLGFGGHAHAAGVHIDLAQLGLLRADLHEHAKTLLKPDDFHRVILHDGPIGTGEITEALIEQMSRAAPFGRGNQEPVFCLSGVYPANIRELRGGHLRGQIRGTRLDFIAFGMPEKQPLMNHAVDMLVVPEINEWQGKRTLQLRVKDLRPTALY